MGEAEDQDHELAAEGLVADALAGVGGKRERAADQGLAGGHGGALGTEHAQPGKAENGRGDEDGEEREKPCVQGGAFCRAAIPRG